VLNHVTWAAVAELAHPGKVTGAGVVVFREERESAAPSESGDADCEASPSQRRRYVVVETPVEVLYWRVDPSGGVARC